jgi:ribosomal protein L32
MAVQKSQRSKFKIKVKRYHLLKKKFKKSVIAFKKKDIFIHDVNFFLVDFFLN